MFESIPITAYIAVSVIAAAFCVLLFLKGKSPHKKKTVVVITAVILIVASAGVMLTPLVVNNLPYKFETEPVIFDAGDSYSIMWATNKNASAKVEVKLSNGELMYYTDAADGVGDFMTRIHAVSVPKTVLENENASYRVISRKTVDTSGYGYKLGKELTSAYYTPVLKKEGEGESILAFSDVQGGEKYAEKALKNVDRPYNFVLLLGDYSSYYNSVSDFIDPLLKLAAIASKSVLPCVYVTGNHEMKGTLAKEVNRLFKTPSPENRRYYTYTYNDLFMTVLDFGDDHDDDMPRYNGASECDAYKDAEYKWLTEEVIPDKRFEGYKYNIAVAHIPIIYKNNIFTYESICKECDKPHGYKHREFKAALESMNISLMLSAHTHSPRIVTHTDCAFPNLQTGAVEKKIGKNGFTCNIIEFRDGDFENYLYRS